MSVFYLCHLSVFSSKPAVPKRGAVSLGSAVTPGSLSHGQFDQSEKSCSDVINIEHSLLLFELTREVACLCEQHCGFYLNDLNA